MGRRPETVFRAGGRAASTVLPGGRRISCGVSDRLGARNPVDASRCGRGARLQGRDAWVDRKSPPGFARICASAGRVRVRHARSRLDMASLEGAEPDPGRVGSLRSFAIHSHVRGTALPAAGVLCLLHLDWTRHRSRDRSNQTHRPRGRAAAAGNRQRVELRLTLSRRALALAAIVMVGLGIRVTYVLTTGHSASILPIGEDLAQHIVAHGRWFVGNVRAEDLLGTLTERSGRLVDPASVNLSYVDQHGQWYAEVDHPVGASVVTAGLWAITGSERFLQVEIFQSVLDVIVALAVFCVGLE